MKEFILYVISHLVDEPNQIRLNEILGQHTLVYELHVGDNDVGKVIGRHGNTIRSLRILLSAAAAKQGKRIILEIMEGGIHQDVVPAGRPLPV
ncbi:KH domain-containing protein [bacterium]|nr:KH domain-containing protein [bacterium]